MKRLFSIAMLLFGVLVENTGSGIQAEDGLERARIFTDVELADRATAVFVGRIEEVFCCGIATTGQLASVSTMAFDCAGPCIEYSTNHRVTVLDVLRGELASGQTAQVEKVGGTLDGDSQYYAGDGPMKVGEEYLLFTSYVPPGDWYSVNAAGQGNIRLDNDPNRNQTVAYWKDVLANLPCDVSDAFVWDGVTYGRVRWNNERRYVPRGLVGDELGHVATSTPGGNACREAVPNLGANVLAEGTPIRAIDGYAASFRLAAMKDDHFVLYQAVWNEHAILAKDVYDIRGRVVAIGSTVYSECVDFWSCEFLPNPRAEIDVEALVDMFLGAPVDATRVIRDGWDGRYTQLIWFELDDSGVVQIWSDSSYSLNGIQMSEVFTYALSRAPFQADD